MPTINRSCSIRIITRALTFDGQPFTAILPHRGEDCIPASDVAALQRLLDQNPDSMVIYNQHAEAVNRLDELTADPQQIVLEIRQETRGVLGLLAKYKNANAGETLELIYQ